MKEWLYRAPLLVVVVVLLLAGGRDYVTQEEDYAAAALVAAALLVLGVWVALEAIAVHQRMHRDDPDDRDGEGER